MAIKKVLLAAKTRKRSFVTLPVHGHWTADTSAHQFVGFSATRLNAKNCVKRSVKEVIRVKRPAILVYRVIVQKW